MEKRKFRKVYLITAEANIFTKYNYQSVDIYRTKADAERIRELKQKEAINEAGKMYNAGEPIPLYKVHGFYLIHEKYFDENG